jgi:hypothetical protein
MRFSALIFMENVSPVRFSDAHAEHPMFMFCSASVLPKLHKALIANGSGDRMEIAPGYLWVLREATRQPEQGGGNFS